MILRIPGFEERKPNDECGKSKPLRPICAPSYSLANAPCCHLPSISKPAADRFIQGQPAMRACDVFKGRVSRSPPPAALVLRSQSKALLAPQTGYVRHADKPVRESDGSRQQAPQSPSCQGSEAASPPQTHSDVREGPAGVVLFTEVCAQGFQGARSYGFARAAQWPVIGRSTEAPPHAPGLSSRMPERLYTRFYAVTNPARIADVAKLFQATTNIVVEMGIANVLCDLDMAKISRGLEAQGFRRAPSVV